MIDFIKALRSLYPNSSWSINGDNYDGLNWLDETQPKPNEATLIEEYNRLRAEEDKNAYKAERALEYPSIQEQLDMQYWDKINGTNNWEQAIQAVKEKYPKPE